MNDAEFHQRVIDALRRIEHAVETSGADIEFENAGEILTLEFTNGTKIIVNKQGAARQIWVAAKSSRRVRGFWPQLSSHRSLLACQGTGPRGFLPAVA